MSLEHRLLAKLTDPLEIARVWDMGLKPEVFEDPPLRMAYEFIVDYWQTSQMKVAPTGYVIQEQIPGLTLVDDPEAEAWWLAKQLMKRYARNELQEALLKATDLAHDSTVEDSVEKTWHWLQSRAYEVNEIISPRYSRSDMSDYEARRQRYRYREDGNESGIGFGIPELDEVTGGIRPGEVAAIGAYSKVGKTMFMLYAAAEARKAGYQPIVFSLEMPIDEIEERLDALLSGVSYSRLSRHKLSVQELKELHAMQEAVADMGPLRVESPDEGERTVANLCARARYTGSDFMLIDQLSFMEETVKVTSEKQRQASIIKQLKNEIGRDSRGKLPCLLAAQLNRESLDRPDGPLIKDFADAAEVERTCDLLLALSRTKQEQGNRTMKLHILGGRRCEIARWLLNWDLVDRSHISVLDRITRSSS